MPEIKDEKRKRKKNKKIIFQVSRTILIFVVLAIFLNAAIVFGGSVKLFLEAKSDTIRRDLLREKASILDYKYLPWILDYLEEHPEEILAEAIDTETMFEESQPYSELSYILTDKDPDKQISALSEQEKLYFSRMIYYILKESMKFDQYQYDYFSMFLVDIREGNRGFVFFDGEEDVLGTIWEYDRRSHTAFKVFMSGKFEETEFDAAQPLKGNDMFMYTGYTPIIIDGEVRCVLCISYDWTEPFKRLVLNIGYMILISIIGLVVIHLLFSLFLYRIAVRPLSMIKKALQDYIDDKDSNKVESSMDAVRSRNEFGVLADDVTHLALEIDRYTNENIKLASEREKVAAELDLAAKLQDSMLPKEFPERRELFLSASMNPAKEVGGDFYDFFFIDDDHLGLVIADVSGKGIPAALFMMVSKTIVKNIAMTGISPSEVLKKTNIALCENNKNDMFVTVWFGILELSTGHVRAANAGHEYPMIKNKDGRFAMLKDKHGFVLGGMEMAVYREYDLYLDEGGVLFVYTDGAPEATNDKGELFGVQRMLDALNGTESDKPDVLLKEVRSSIDVFSGAAPQFDDLTMLCVTWNGSGGSGKRPAGETGTEEQAETKKG